MTTEHDFQDCLNVFEHTFSESQPDGTSGTKYVNADLAALYISEFEHTIRFSLRLADKLLKQEPSEGMVQAHEKAMDYYLKHAFDKDKKEYLQSARGLSETVFKSMLTTAVKEIENGA